MDGITFGETKHLDLATDLSRWRISERHEVFKVLGTSANALECRNFGTTLLKSIS